MALIKFYLKDEPKNLDEFARSRAQLYYCLEKTNQMNKN